MDQNIKNRLVGIVVFSALAVIFLPMVLDGSGVRKSDFTVEIPPEPVVEADAEFEAKVIELNAQVEAIPELEQRYVDEVSSEDLPVQFTADKAKTTQGDAKAEKPAVSEQAPVKVGGDSFVLQVGSFKDRKKALVQRDKLRNSNISAVFIEQFESSGKTTYRVRLGPFINRQQSRVAQNKVKAKHDIDGIIMKYER